MPIRTLGIDLGTSGVRAVVLDDRGEAASHAVPIDPARRWDAGALWAGVVAVLQELDLSGVLAIAVDGTSGTIVPVGAGGEALGALSPYNAVADAGVVAAIRAVVPASSAAQGATSALGRAIGLLGTPGLRTILHEADWIAGRLCGRFDTTDENNALKTGYDPVDRRWPVWLGDAGLRAGLLPRVLPPGAVVATVTAAMASRLGLPPGVSVVAGTTDGCASFLSTGADLAGDAVTALGSTLTLKLLSDSPVFAPNFGVYSHRLLGRWLAGGASNSGGAVLAAHFSPDRLAELSHRIDPDRDSGLDYYPLLRPGERFPVNDPDLPPRMNPRPPDDAAFLHGLLEGIARIEARGYRLLAEHGAPLLTRVLTVGGGAANPTWTAMRARILGVPVQRATTSSAALGAAMLARRALA